MFRPERKLIWHRKCPWALWLFYILFTALHLVCYVCSASAASCASSLLGPELLSHIRLPAWAELQPVLAPAAAAGTNSAQLPKPSSSSSIWWHSSISSSSAQQVALTNQQWLQALHYAAPGDDAPLDQLNCDCCSCPITLPQQQQADYVLYSCAGCGVAVYCSSSCRASDSRSHSRQCRLLQAVAQPGGDSRDWPALTAAAAAGGSSLMMLKRAQ
jgi:hypothetical protein